MAANIVNMIVLTRERTVHPWTIRHGHFVNEQFENDFSKYQDLWLKCSWTKSPVDDISVDELS